MKRVIDQDKVAMKKRYADSTRHTIQVDYWPYIFQLRKAVAGKLDRPKKVTA